MTEDKPFHLSFSSMSMYKQCPKRWEYRYVQGLADPSGYAAVLGTFVHLVLEFFFRLPPAERTVEALKSLAREKWEEFVVDNEDFDESVGEDEDDQRLFRQKAWKSMVSLWEFENPESVDVVQSELAFNINIDGVDVKGFIDRVERKFGKLQIVDYKSGKAPRKIYVADKLEQVYLYGAAIDDIFGELPSKGSLYFLGSEIVHAPTTKPRVDMIRRKIGETVVSINKSKKEGFKPIPGPLCGWCSYLPMCKSGQEYLVDRFKQGNLKKTAPGHPLIKELASA